MESICANVTFALIKHKLYYIELLKNFFIGIDKLNDTCDILKSITSYFSLLNLNLNRILKSNTSTIHEVINPKELLIELEKFLKEKNRGVSFPLKSEKIIEFYDITQVKLYYKNYKVTLGFEIPVYRRTNLFNVFTKPILKNDIPQILDTKTKFAIINATTVMFYSKQSFNINGFAVNDTYVLLQTEIRKLRHLHYRHLL